MDGLDLKRFIDVGENPDFAGRMAAEFAAGRIPPFGMVFGETTVQNLENADKRGKQIIQFSFLLTDADRNVLLHSRSDRDDSGPAGHTNVLGRAALVSWSPVLSSDGMGFPQSEEDVLNAFGREVKGLPDQPEPVPNFLGLMRRIVPPKPGRDFELVYWFYLFEMRFAPGCGPFGQHLIKDKHDVLATAFSPVDDPLLTSIDGKPVDQCAIHAITGRDTCRFDSVKFVPHRLEEPTPWSVKPPGVFISYSSVDREFALRIRDAVEAEGYPTWLDEDRLRPGRIWYVEAEEAIRYCQVFLCLCSPDSFKSEPVLLEVRQMLSRLGEHTRFKTDVRCQIIPALVRGSDVKAIIPAGIPDRKAVDLRDPSRFDVGFQKLMSEVRATMGTPANRRD